MNTMIIDIFILMIIRILFAILYVLLITNTILCVIFNEIMLFFIHLGIFTLNLYAGYCAGFRFIKKLKIVLVILIVSISGTSYLVYRRTPSVEENNMYIYCNLLFYITTYTLLLLTSNKLLPLQVISKNLNTQVACAICLVESNVLHETKCKHLFHQKCIDEWINVYKNTTCPTCRCVIHSTNPNDLLLTFY